MVVVGFVDIGGIVDHHCLNFLFILFFVTFVRYTNVPTVYIFLTNVVCMNPTHGEVYLMQYSGIKFVSDLRQIGGFLWVLWFPPPMKLSAKI